MPARTHHRQDGVALIAAIGVGIVLMILAALVMSISLSETTQSHRQVRLSASSQAAEAGIDDYVSKLTEHHEYANYFVHPAEAARQATDGTVVTGGSPWSHGNTWTYPAGATTTWRTLGNGFEYSLQVVPPSPGARAITIRSTGRQIGNTESRTYEATIRPATVLDYHRIVERNANFAADAQTGKIYVGGDLSHPGTARGDVLVEGAITTSPTLVPPARIYTPTTAPNIRSVVPNPILFNQFAVSITTVQSAASASGIYLDAADAKAWRLRFNADGTVTIQKCTGGPGTYSGILDYYARGLAGLTPVPCTAFDTRPVPANGAIYANQLVLLSGTVNGRATVVSNQDMILEGPTNYVDGRDDTLGMIPKLGFLVAYYVRTNSPTSHFQWWGSVLVIDHPNTWGAKTVAGSGPSGLTQMTHRGSVITPTTGNMSVIPNRSYIYDDNLQFLQPPYFPVLEGSYTTQGFRELAPS